MRTPAFASSQRGAIGLTSAALLILLVLFLALTVDSGRLYLEKRNLQRIADLAALESAELGLLCSADSQQQATLSAQNNGFNTSDPKWQLSTRLGRIVQDSQGRRSLITGSPQAHDGVEVTVKHRIPASIVANLASMLPGSNFSTETELQAQATAQSQNFASFTVGSGLLNLNSSASPLLQPILGALLDGNVNLGVLTPSGIASANIELLEFLKLLRAQANVGTLEGLLNTRVQALPFVEVIASALTPQHVVGANLNGVKLAQIQQLNVTLAQVLGIAANTPQEALKAKVNLFDLLLVGAFAANSKNSLDLNLSIPNLTSLKLLVTEKPKLAYGPPGKDSSGQWLTLAKTGQLELVANVQTSVAGLLSLTGYLLDVQVDLALRIGLAEAEGALASIECSATPNHAKVRIAAKTHTDSIRITAASDKTKPAVVKVTTKVGSIITDLLTLRLDLGSTAVIGSQTGTLDYNVSLNNDPQSITPTKTQQLQSPLNLQLPTLNVVSVTIGNEVCTPVGLFGLNCVAAELLNATLHAILTFAGGLINLVNMLLSALSSLLLQPLLSALGIQLGLADITLHGVETTPAQLVR